MRYVEKIGLNAKKAFKELKAINHNQIKSVLKSELFFGLITDEATAKIIIKNS